METIDLASVMATFLALVGPQKVLLSFAEVTEDLDVSVRQQIAVLSTVAAGIVGAGCALAAPAITGFFHVTAESIELEGGLILFIYAVCLVLGMRLGADHGLGSGDSDVNQPVVDGFRQMLLPFVVSPLGVTAVLVDASTGGSWGWRSTVAGAYVAVVIVNMICMLVLGPVMRRAHATALNVVLVVLTRLLGLLLAAVGVELFLQGLTGLGVPFK